ncbi:MAG: hypothetical protein JWL64_1197, partial [Frankiales bacterium]|nr:hypothetical protein [Frankiales bacterium]
TGRDTFTTEGQLDLTTVSVVRSVTLGDAVRGWFARDTAVSPKEFYFPPGKSTEEVKAEDAQAMVESQSSAKTAALGQLGIPVTVAVKSVTPTGPSAGKLRAGDVLLAVEGTPVTNPAGLVALIGSHPIGTDLPLRIRRDGQEQDVTITTASSGGDKPRPVIGITPTVTDFPFDITISLEDIGGPSAGLMFALGIIEKLGPESLTEGKHIAGTGEITDDGVVHPIGGIQQKMAAAGKEGVKVFLVPTDNCADAQANRPDGVELVRVTTLDSAVKALELLAQGGTPQGCA